jgi:hypothetical protein
MSQGKGIVSCIGSVSFALEPSVVTSLSKADLSNNNEKLFRNLFFANA